MQSIQIFRYNLISAGRKAMAAFALASIFLILLLSLNFHVWGGHSRQGDLEDMVKTHEAMIGGSGLPAVYGQGSDSLHLRQQPLEDAWGGSCFGFISGRIFFPVSFSVPLYSEWLQLPTLCSLSVRMNR